MSETTQRRGSVEVLGEPESLALLGQNGVGRIAFTDEKGVMVLPVNYIVAEGFISFRSDSASLLRCVPMRRVAFEVDGADDDGAAWSVVARGYAREVGDALNVEYERLRSHPTRTILPQTPRHLFAIDVESVSGRLITSATA